LSVLLAEPDLNRGVTRPDLKSLGMTPLRNERLMMCVNGGPMTFATSFRKPGGILSNPTALLHFRFLRCEFTSLTGTLLKLNATSGLTLYFFL